MLEHEAEPKRKSERSDVSWLVFNSASLTYLSQVSKVEVGGWARFSHLCVCVINVCVHVCVCLRVLTTHDLFGNTHKSLQGNKWAVKERCPPPPSMMKHRNKDLVG